MNNHPEFSLRNLFTRRITQAGALRRRATRLLGQIVGGRAPSASQALLNAAVLPQNRDWVWPCWVERQLDPRHPAFVAGSEPLTQPNITFRSWTSVGHPDAACRPLVDPCGLLTPLPDGWSLDAWIIPDAGRALVPSRAPHIAQRVLAGDELVIETRASQDGSHLHLLADVVIEDHRPVCRLQVAGACEKSGWLVIAVRPFNGLGVSPIRTILLNNARTTLDIDGVPVHFARAPDRVCLSRYEYGDVYHDLRSDAEGTSITCTVGLATAAAMFRMQPEHATELVVRVPLEHARVRPRIAPGDWRAALGGFAALQVPDARFQLLWTCAARRVLLGVNEALAAPRLVFSPVLAIAAAALVQVGGGERVRRLLRRICAEQQWNGSVAGDAGDGVATAQALWLIDLSRRSLGSFQPLPDEFVRRAGRWLVGRAQVYSRAGRASMSRRARLAHVSGSYANAFWHAAGLKALATLLYLQGDAGGAVAARALAERVLAHIDASLDETTEQRTRAGLPAGPRTRVAASSAGSLIASFPLRLWPARDPRILDTADYLLASLLNGAVFLEEPAGLHAQTTLLLAETLMHAGDSRFAVLVDAAADLASPTGQWPEAVHPHTHAGCAGDPEHLGAAALWLLTLRDLFIRDDAEGLVLGPGILPRWLNAPAVLRLGPCPTRFGPVSVEIAPQRDGWRVAWSGQWSARPPRIEIRLPGNEPQVMNEAEKYAWIARAPDPGHPDSVAPTRRGQAG